MPPSEISLNIDTKEIAEKLITGLMDGIIRDGFEKAIKAEIENITKHTWNQQSIVQNAVRNFLQDRLRRILEENAKDIDAELEKVIKEKLPVIIDEMKDKIQISVKNY